MKKNVLMIVNYFYPDVASGAQLMKELCEELQGDFKLTVIAAIPSYANAIPEKYKEKRIFREKYQDIEIIRVAVPEVNKKSKISRMKYITTYFFNAIVAIKKSDKQDLVFAISQPPIIGGVLGWIAKLIKKAKLIYNIQDFTPEVVEAIGYSKNKILIETARGIDKFTCRKADRVLVVGRDMIETIKKRFGDKNNVNVALINNWIDETKTYPLSNNDKNVIAFIEKYGLMNKVVFMYSGNIGLYYDLKNIMKVICKFKDDDNLVFAFIGDGAVKNDLVKYCNENNLENVKFIPYQNKEDLIYSLNAADIHIVTNAKGIKGVSVPSKIYGVMAVGKAVLGILEKGSEARCLIEDSNCGVCCEPGDYEKIEKLIKKMMNSHSEFTNNGRSYIDKYLKKSDCMSKYKELFNEVMK